MSMSDKPGQNEEFELDDLLDSLAQEAPLPSSALLGRVLEDAYDEQPLVEEPVAEREKQRFSFLSVFGGWGGLSGLAAAASVGFFLGFNPPAALEERVPLVSDGGFVNLDEDITGFGWDFEEDLSL